jgi:hypothetical protein
VQGAALRTGEKGPNSGEEASSSNAELESAQLARTEEPFAAKPKTHQGLSRDRLNREQSRCVQSEDQAELIGTSGE